VIHAHVVCCVLRGAYHPAGNSLRNAYYKEGINQTDVAIFVSPEFSIGYYRWTHGWAAAVTLLTTNAWQIQPPVAHAEFEADRDGKSAAHKAIVVSEEGKDNFMQSAMGCARCSQ
jgi:hypothetical protein